MCLVRHIVQQGLGNRVQADPIETAPTFSLEAIRMRECQQLCLLVLGIFCRFQVRRDDMYTRHKFTAELTQWLDVYCKMLTLQMITAIGAKRVWGVS